MDTKLAIGMIALLLAAAAQAASVNATNATEDFIIWLKCKIIELYTNGIFTLRCEDFLPIGYNVAIYFELEGKEVQQYYHKIRIKLLRIE
jgi:hypothetical protein